jgi:hypothetical protein
METVRRKRVRHRSLDQLQVSQSCKVDGQISQGLGSLIDNEDICEKIESECLREYGTACLDLPSTISNCCTVTQASA